MLTDYAFGCELLEPLFPHSVSDIIDINRPSFSFSSIQ